MRSPEITAFNNGVIEWKKDGNCAVYVVKINGAVVAESCSNTFNAAGFDENTRIDIAVKFAGGALGPETSVMYDVAKKKLFMLPVHDCVLSGDILIWGNVGGAVGYKIVDLDFNVYMVNTAHYIMSSRNIIYGVYPVMPKGGAVESAKIEPMDIAYLPGSGTPSDPYVIKTPIELRTIDYYELKYVERGGARNHYRLDCNIDYNVVSALETESNIYTLRKPFYGTLDGNGKTLYNLSVHYGGGFWALFEFMAVGSTVKDITFDNAELNNTVINNEHPINPTVAMLAYNNYGTVSGITVKSSRYKVRAGAIAGIVAHNYGTVSDCSLFNCELSEGNTVNIGHAAYEVGGVVLENLGGGTVKNCAVKNLSISGVGNNIGSAAGIVAINRSGGVVSDNSYDGVSVKNIRADKECGGVVAYCARGGIIESGSGTLGMFTVGGVPITTDKFEGAPRGKLYGKHG